MNGLGSWLVSATSVEGICWLHREFCSRLPESLLTAKDPQSGELVLMIPGELRKYYVKVGRHLAPEPDAVLPMLNRLVEAYTSKMISKPRKVLGIAASHHRLTWIHPFMDGNGRVARLFSHALLREQGIGSELGRYREVWRAGWRRIKAGSWPPTNRGAAIAMAEET
jgi:Fic family protein